MAHFRNKVVRNPVVVLKIEAGGLGCQVALQALLRQDRVRQSLVLQRRLVFKLRDCNVVQLLDLPSDKIAFVKWSALQQRDRLDVAMAADWV
jgi:hypothetical protein